MALSTIPTRALSEQGINFRNLIINGDMSIAQRGTSTSGLTSNAYGSVDRFHDIINGSGTWTSSQVTDVPTGQGFAKSMKMNCTTSDSTPNYLFVNQKIEGQFLQHLKKGTSNAESVTLSFWVKSNKTGTYIVELYDADNARRISKSYTISSSSTWEKKTLTYSGDTTGAFDNDNGGSLQVNFWLSAGTSYTSGTLGTSWSANTNADRAVGQVNLADSTSNEWYITGVQLEVGTSASDFEFLPYDVNLTRCERYFQKHDGFEGTASQTTQFQSVQTFHTPMRANPSASISGVLVVTDTDSDYTQSSANGAITAGRVSTTAVQLNFGNFSGMTRFRPTQQNVGANSCHMQMDAEL